MENLIDELHNDYLKFSRALDLLTEQLDRIQEGKSADYHSMLDAVSYIENYPKLASTLKEDTISKKSTGDHKLIALGNTIKRLRSENHELTTLAHELRDSIDAVLEGIIFEKELLEQQLETCIQRQRDHMNTEETLILPLLRKKMSEQQLKQFSLDFQS